MAGWLAGFTLSSGSWPLTTLPAKVTVSPDALYQVVAGETVLLHQGCYYSLDEIASRVWQLLIQGDSPEAIIARLLEEYDTTQGQLREDLHALFHRLAEAGLVQVEP